MVCQALDLKSVLHPKSVILSEAVHNVNPPKSKETPENVPTISCGMNLQPPISLRPTRYP